jgi:hypothetical protein
MKRSHQTTASTLREVGIGRFLAALMCLLLLGLQPSAFAQAEGPDTAPESGSGTGSGEEDDDDSGGGDGMAGDETVGTLPSRATDDPPPGGPIHGPKLGGVSLLSPDGALTMVGSSSQILDVLSRSRSGGLVTVGLDSGGGARATFMSDFRLRLRPADFAELGLDATLDSRLGISARVSWNGRSNLVQLGSGASLDLPLSQIAASSALARSPMVIDSVNSFGVTTRLTLSLERGFVVLTQTRS